jgi:flagellar L-ring protein precursor FlgH
MTKRTEFKWQSVIVIAAMTLTACAPTLGEYKHRKRTYKAPVAFPQVSEKPVQGSLWTPTIQGNYLFADQRAMRIGDIVTVVVEESANARRGASTTLDRDSAMSNTITDFLGLLKKFQPSLVGAEMLGTKTSTDFKGMGETSRSEKLNATIPATVKKVMPNGNLYIEGHRTILVNAEEHHFYISGVVRPVDISDNNSVSSSRLAEAEIEFGGRGDITDKQRPGIISRTLDKYNPF